MDSFPILGQVRFQYQLKNKKKARKPSQFCLVEFRLPKNKFLAVMEKLWMANINSKPLICDLFDVKLSYSSNF